ncbi:MAG TPA: twin-arginine translocase TatA/TatE family subunit [Verrucomicrobiae bacterium]|jgi:sec-independent protein translocase protein TatA
MNTMLAVFGLGGWEVVLILAVVLILFGAKKLPELAKGLGQGIREFKKASNEITSELQRAGEEDASHRQVQYHPPEKTIEASTSTSQPDQQKA